MIPAEQAEKLITLLRTKPKYYKASHLFISSFKLPTSMKKILILLWPFAAVVCAVGAGATYSPDEYMQVTTIESW